MRRMPMQLGGILVVITALLCAVTVGTVAAGQPAVCPGQNAQQCSAVGGTFTGGACVIQGQPVEEETPGVGPGGQFTRTETCVTTTTITGSGANCMTNITRNCTVTACTNPGGRPANPRHCE